MSLRVVAASFVVVWLALFTIEFLEEIHFFEFSNYEVAEAADVAVASFGQALQKSTDTQSTASYILFNPPLVFFTSSIRSTWLRQAKIEIEFIKEIIPLYKLHRAFLI